MNIQSLPSIEFHDAGVTYPAQKIPTFKEWVVRGVTGRHERRGFTALRGVTFSVMRGEAFGIIGPNGAGKSTLLRVAAGIIPPSAGHVVTRGTMAPLIELGTGFDGELTGIENIFFNGALLGRSRLHMQQRLDEIATFAGLGEFLKAPLRTYSTGMVARLAFAIAITVDPDIVLMDEILSVGDASFQERCQERIRRFHDNGSTLVLVSHDLKAVTGICSRAAWVDEGSVQKVGPAQEVVDAYLTSLHLRAVAAAAAAAGTAS